MINKVDLTDIIKSIEHDYSVFEKKIFQLENDWKDQRKDEYFAKHIDPRKNTIKNSISTLHQINTEIDSINILLRSS